MIFLSLILLTSMASIATASDWGQFQSDWKNSAFEPGPAVKAKPEMIWYEHTSANGDNGINVPPVIAGDLVYTYTTNGSVWAFNKHNGELVWSNYI